MEIISRITSNNDVLSSYVGFCLKGDNLQIFFNIFTVEYVWKYDTKYSITIYDLEKRIMYSCLIDNKTKLTHISHSTLGPSIIGTFFDELTVQCQFNIILMYEEFRRIIELEDTLDATIAQMENMSFENKIEELN